MLVLQAVTLCLALCIFSLQAKYSYGESTASENNLQSVTLNDKWEEYGCKNNPLLEKPFGKLELCLGTVINDLILRILQNYSPTPLPEHLIVSGDQSGYEDQIRKYIETYLPQMAADEIKMEHVFDQVNEYIFTPLRKYSDQFPIDILTPQEQAVIDSRREEIANILKKYMKAPLNPVVPVTASSFQENLPAIVRYLTRYAPDLTENLDVLTLLLYRIKKDGFKEIAARDLSKLPKTEYDEIVSKVSNVINQHKNPADRFDIVLPYFIHDFQSFKPWLFRHFESFIPNLFANKPMLKKVLKQIEEIFEGIEPTNSTADNINGLDKVVLLKFVEKYYPEQFRDQVFIEQLVQNYDAQTKSNVTPTSEPDNNQIKNALFHFFKKVYPKLSLDERFVKQFAEDFKADRRYSVDSTVEVIESATEPATTTVSDVEFIPEPSRKIKIEDTPEELSAEISEDSESEPIRSYGTAEQDPTYSEQKIILQKILECIQETFPHIYANKAVLAEILKQLETDILPGNEETSVSVEKQIRTFTEADVPKIAEDGSDTARNIAEEKVIEFDITPRTKPSVKTVGKFYIVRGNANGAATVSLSTTKPDASAIKPGQRVIEIDLTPENKTSGKRIEKLYILKGQLSQSKPDTNAVEPGQKVIEINITPDNEKSGKRINKVYIVNGNGGAGKVSLENIKPNQNAVGSVQVSVSKPDNQETINLKPNNAFGQIKKEHADNSSKEYMKIINNFQENAYRTKPSVTQPTVEPPKGTHLKIIEVLQPASGNYNDRFKEYLEYEKLGSMQFPYEHHFFPLMVRSYGPLYEKEHNGKALTKQERVKMNVLETLFGKNQAFHQLYQKKFGPQDNLGIKAMLYNMYKVDLKENGGKLIQIDPIKNIKFIKYDHSKFFDDNNDENQMETLEG